MDESLNLRIDNDINKLRIVVSILFNNFLFDLSAVDMFLPDTYRRSSVNSSDGVTL